MRSIMSTAAVLGAAAVALTLGVTSAPAAFTLGQNESNFDFGSGIDISGVPLDSKDVHAYIAGLAPETQAVAMDTCANYMAHPADATSPDTVPFCQLVLG